MKMINGKRVCQLALTSDAGICLTLCPRSIPFHIGGGPMIPDCGGCPYFNETLCRRTRWQYFAGLLNETTRRVLWQMPASEVRAS